MNIDLRAQDFSAFPAVGRTSSAVATVALALTKATPRLRNFRQVQKLLNELSATGAEGNAQFRALQQSLQRAKERVDALERVEVSTAVVDLRAYRRQIERVRDELVSCLATVEAFQRKLDTLKKHSKVIRDLAPDFEASVRVFEIAMTNEGPKLRELAESLRTGAFFAAIDEAIDLAVDQATEHALERSKSIALAKTKPPTVDDAMKSLDAIGEFAKTHGIKLGTG